MMESACFLGADGILRSNEARSLGLGFMMGGDDESCIKMLQGYLGLRLSGVREG